MLPTCSGGMLQMLEPWNAAIEVADGLSKAKMAITRIGRDRKGNTISAQAANPGSALILRTQLLLPRGEQDVEDDEQRQRRQQRDRHRGPAGLVLVDVEL